MGWNVKCASGHCGERTRAANIVDLIQHYRDKDGWIVCRCGKRGYIEKSFPLQEPGETWEPFLLGVIPLGIPDDTYQPFVFLVGKDGKGPVDAIWFSYYKDLRVSGGLLKLGYGPGGPPVLGLVQLIDLLKELTRLGCLSAVVQPSA